MPTSAKVLECSVPPCAHLVFVDLNLLCNVYKKTDSCGGVFVCAAL